MSVSRFWASVERVESDYVADCDRKRFRRRMRRKGFHAATIAERESALDVDHGAYRGAPPQC